MLLALDTRAARERAALSPHLRWLRRTSRSSITTKNAGAAALIILPVHGDDAIRGFEAVAHPDRSAYIHPYVKLCGASHPRYDRLLAEQSLGKVDVVTLHA